MCGRRKGAKEIFRAVLLDRECKGWLGWFSNFNVMLWIRQFL